MFLNILIALVLAVCALAAPTPASNGTSLQGGDNVPSESPSKTFEPATPATPSPDLPNSIPSVHSSRIQTPSSFSGSFSFHSSTPNEQFSKSTASSEFPTPSSSIPANNVPSSLLPSSSPTSPKPSQIQPSPFSSRLRPSSSRLAPVPTTGPREIAGYLFAHNSVRVAHGASPLAWSSDLAQVAQTWANRCEFRHSDGELGPYGENLAAGAGRFPVQSAVDLFISEPYDAANPTFSHFTQVVWKSTTQLGCAVALCDGIFDAKYGKATYHVCMYNPVGNIVGEAKLNVQA